ncbi:uncharacterized protein ACRADG_008978 [Cochliomyia hominivorax]
MLKFIIFLTFLKCLTSYPVPNGKSSIVRIHTKGVLPLESDVLLPYSIIQKIYAQQMANPHFKAKIHAVIRPQNEALQKYRKSRNRNNFIKPTVAKDHIHFKRDRFNARTFRLYDDDGEYLLNLKYPDNAALSAIQPSIINTTTMYVDDSKLTHSAKDHNRNSKRIVQHVWINLK